MKISTIILLLIFSVLNINKSSGQCENLSFLNTLFIGGFEDVDVKLTNKNYTFLREMVTGFDYKHSSSDKLNVYNIDCYMMQYATIT